METPTNQKIPRDDVFKTCKSTMPSPARRRLRMTPARESILSGGKPFKEVTPAKKFNNVSSRRLNRSNLSQKNDTNNSKDTFIVFDQDSLETGSRKCSSTPKQIAGAINLQQLEENLKKVGEEINVESPTLTKQATFLKKKTNENEAAVKEDTVKKDAGKRTSLKVSAIKKSPKKKSPKKNPMPPPAVPPRNTNKNKNVQEKDKRPLFTPKVNQFRKPTSFASTTSRYLSQSYTTRRARSASFKSTAELERDFFNSLRSF